MPIMIAQADISNIKEGKIDLQIVNGILRIFITPLELKKEEMA